MPESRGSLWDDNNAKCVALDARLEWIGQKNSLCTQFCPTRNNPHAPESNTRHTNASFSLSFMEYLQQPAVYPTLG